MLDSDDSTNCVDAGGCGQIGKASVLGKRDGVRQSGAGATGNRITPRNCFQVQKAKMVETTLYQTFMRLGGFGMIGDAGAKFLAQMQQIQSLVSLDLSGNTIGCAGLQALMNRIYFGTTLTSLVLSGNPLEMEERQS